jgi:AraC-like DNA-binding protein
MFLNELTYDIKVPDDFVAMQEGMHAVRISYGCSVFENESNVALDDNREFLGLYFNLSNNLTYTFNDLFSGTLHKGQYMVVYLPEAHSKFIIDKGKYSVLGFHFTRELLQNLVPDFPFLEGFLNTVALKQPCMLTEVPLTATDEMLQAIKGILANNSRRENDRNIHFFSRVFDILTLCLAQVSVINNPGYKNYQYYRDKIEKIQMYLVDHVQDHCTLSFLADHVGMEKHTLVRAFKKLCGVTLMDFLTSERMKKAMTLMRNSNMTLQQIGQRVGYKNHTHFTKAFKRNLNITPSLFRHNAFKEDKASLQ